MTSLALASRQSAPELAIRLHLSAWLVCAITTPAQNNATTATNFLEIVLGMFKIEKIFLTSVNIPFTGYDIGTAGKAPSCPRQNSRSARLEENVQRSTSNVQWPENVIASPRLIASFIKRWTFDVERWTFSS